MLPACRKSPTLAVVCLLAAALVAFAAPPAAAQTLQMIETPDLRLIYTGGAEGFLIPHAGRTFMNSLDFQKRTFGHEPWEKPNLLLLDLSDVGNAGASAIPRNFLSVQIAPLGFAFETLAANDRMNVIMNHELVHVAMMDRAAGPDRFWRKVFGGKVSPVAAHPESILYLRLTAPRTLTPRWFLEGAAVFADTWMAGGLGRAQSGWDEMVFRAMTRDDARFYDPLGLVAEGTKIDFQTQVHSYLYGTRFLLHVAMKHGPEKLVDWFARREGSKADFAADFRRLFGASIETEWARFVEEEKAFQNQNLEAIRKHPLTPYEDLSPKALGSVSRAFFDPASGKLYAGLNYPGTIAHVGAIDVKTGEIDKLVDIKGPTIYTVTSLAWDAKARKLFYTSDNVAFRDIVELDPQTGKTRVLQKDARIGDLAIDASDQSLWGIRHYNGLTTLVRMPGDHTDWNQIRTWPYGEILYDIDISPDGRYLAASFGEITGRQTLRVWEKAKLMAGDATPLREQEFAGATPSSFVFSPDGKWLYGSAYYSGVSNLFRWEVETGTLQALTNAETGFFRPIPQEDGTLVAFRYSGQGFVPVKLAVNPIEDLEPIAFFGQQLVEKYPQLKDWMLGSPAKIPFEEQVQRKESYEPVKRLAFESAYPIVEGYKDFAGPGYALTFSDYAQLAKASFSVSYSPDRDLPAEERLHLRGELKRYDLTLRARWNGADFYDLVGPTKTSRKGFAGGVGWRKTLLYDAPREAEFNADVDYFAGLDTLPEFQNVASAQSRMLSVQAKATYKDLRGSQGKVDDERGMRAELWAGADFAGGEAFPKALASFDVGRPLPIPHSSLFLRSAVGKAWGPEEDPLAALYLGGFGNNWVDHRDEKRYRRWYAFPGAELNELAGRTFVRSTLEWNLPPVRFRRAGKPAFYVSWARPALFAGVAVTDFDAAARRNTTWNAGAQLDFSITSLHALDLVLSVGQAWAFADQRKTTSETMVSLKVLR
ncbi:MAG: hypothetical protein KJ067_16180 [Vicinamibacteria bacterium]|nr:hypothetical protein [Vicinamibacteria bacterium]